MGLDQFLKKKTYIGAEYSHRKVKINIDCEIAGEKIVFDFSKISSISEDIGYWRKANHIHNFFVEQAQGGNDDCGEYYVSEEVLQDLKTRCLEILEKSKIKEEDITVGTMHSAGKTEPIKEKGFVMTNPEIAEKLLPTQAGFFFGNTDYDNYYLESLRETIEIIDRALKNPNRADIYYSSSW